MRWIAAAVALCSGCAVGPPAGARIVHYRAVSPGAFPRAIPPPPLVSATPARLPTSREAVVARARALLGKPNSKDCAGFVSRVFGVDLLEAAQQGDNGVTAIYRFAQRKGRTYRGGRPLAGDLVFFRDTYDLNRDGRWNDGLTHVGIVDSVDRDGRVSFIHRSNRGVVRDTMSDFIRSKARANELFAAYATLH